MIEKAINDLNSAWQGLSEKLYQQTKETPSDDSPGPENSGSTKSNKKDEVEEADFEEVK